MAPFATSKFRWWDKVVGDYTMADGIFGEVSDPPAPQADLPIKLARPEKITQIIWTSDLNYQAVTRIQVAINGKNYLFDTQPTIEAQTFDIPDQPTASELEIKVVGWTHDPNKTTETGVELVGIDHVAIRVSRPPDFAQRVKPLLNVGALVEYPQGKGGIILCNVNFENPANAGSKQKILSVILRNLNAEFAGN